MNEDKLLYHNINVKTIPHRLQTVRKSHAHLMSSRIFKFTMLSFLTRQNKYLKYRYIKMIDITFTLIKLAAFLMVRLTCESNQSCTLKRSEWLNEEILL